MHRLIRRAPAPRTFHFPIRESLRGDLIAGLTVAVMLVPQSMANATIAGLPPIVGLYASVAPLVAYALVGSSRQLAVGPVAIVSLMVASGLQPLAAPGSREYVQYAMLLAAMVGGVHILLALLRGDFLVNFLSRPVITGFLSAAAVIIAVGQMQHLIGVRVPRGSPFHEMLFDLVRSLPRAHAMTLMVGGSSVAALLALKRFWPRFPAALLVVGVWTALSAAFHLENLGVAVTGDVPSGFPAPKLPPFDVQIMRELFPVALAITLIGFTQSISMARALAEKHKYDIDPNRELWGIGLANLAAALFQGYPVTGGFSRSVVNERAGATSGLASIITATVIAAILIFLTPLLHDLPRAVLAAIIIVAVSGLIEVRRSVQIWRVKTADGVLLTLTFAATLIWGIEAGIATGVAASLLWYVAASTRPHFAVLGRIPGTDHFRDLRRFPEAERFSDFVVLRIDAPFYFASAAFLKNTLQGFLDQNNPQPRAVVLDMSGVNDLDYTANEVLRDAVREFRKMGVELYFAGIKGPVQEVMARSGLLHEIGEDHCFFGTADAVRALLASGDNHRDAE